MRPAGRLDPAKTAFVSPTDLASALRRAARAHEEHEKAIGQRDTNWPDWYAASTWCRSNPGERSRSRHRAYGRTLTGNYRLKEILMKKNCLCVHFNCSAGWLSGRHSTLVWTDDATCRASVCR